MMTKVNEKSEQAVNEILGTVAPQFTALVSQIYYLYQRPDETFFISLVGPLCWGPKSPPLVFVSEVVYNENNEWRRNQ
jgi:hypothetical protein